MLRAIQMLSEKRHTHRVCRDLLNWVAKIQTERPELCGPPLYLEVLMRRGGLDEQAAKAILGRATQIFDWHSDRELRFRDVATIIAFDEYLRGQASREGVQANLARLVSRYIPERL